MKKIMNAPEVFVDEMCRGFALTRSDIEYMPRYRVIKRKDINRNKVSLISGGGSGHEPAHGGYVGYGMLDAAVAGDVFASPSQIQVYNALRATASDKGTLLIIKNYSGDVMNFQNAMFLAGLDGVKADYVKVNDDIAVMDSLYTVGRRGVAGTVLVHKIAGAAAEAGLDLPGVKRVAQKAIDNVRSVGFALTSCTVPAKGAPTFAIGEGEMEYGVGIHGEPGISREKPLPADELAKRMITSLVADLGVTSGDEVALLVNGFGATPLQELYILGNAATRELAGRGISLFRCFAGNYMTSIDMAGASLTILKLDDELRGWLSAVSRAPAFMVTGEEKPVPYQEFKTNRPAGDDNFTADASGDKAKIVGGELTLDNAIFLVDKMAEVIIKNEKPFCDLDSFAGDGDFGMSVAKGFRQLKREWPALIADRNQTIGAFLDACSLIIMENCGGASGPIWGFAFKFAGVAAKDKRRLSVADAAALAEAAVNGIQTVGERSFGRGATVGDKTLIDALIPFAQSWRASARNGVGMLEAMKAAAAAAVAGAKATEDIVARMGRAGTVGKRSLGHPDAGAHALGVIFTELAAAMR